MTSLLYLNVTNKKRFFLLLSEIGQHGGFYRHTRIMALPMPQPGTAWTVETLQTYSMLRPQWQIKQLSWTCTPRQYCSMEAAANYVGTCREYAAAVRREQWVPPPDCESESIPVLGRTATGMRMMSPPLLNITNYYGDDDDDDSFAEMEERYPTPVDNADNDDVYS